MVRISKGGGEDNNNKNNVYFIPQYVISDGVISKIIKSKKF